MIERFEKAKGKDCLEIVKGLYQQNEESMVRNGAARLNVFLEIAKQRDWVFAYNEGGLIGAVAIVYNGDMAICQYIFSNRDNYVKGWTLDPVVIQQYHDFWKENGIKTYAIVLNSVGIQIGWYDTFKELYSKVFDFIAMDNFQGSEMMVLGVK